MIDMGVASPSAQGQAMISTDTATTMAYAMAGSGPKKAQMAKAISAMSTTAGTKYAVQHDNWAVMPTGGNKYGGVLPRKMGDFQIRGPGGATLRHPRPLIRYPHGSGTILVEDDIDAGPDFDPPPARPKWRERAPQGTTPPSP